MNPQSITRAAHPGGASSRRSNQGKRGWKTAWVNPQEKERNKNSALKTATLPGIAGTPSAPGPHPPFPLKTAQRVWCESWE